MPIGEEKRRRKLRRNSFLPFVGIRGLYMKYHKTKIYIIIASLLFAPAMPSYAEDYASDSFTVKDSIISDFGGFSTSTSFMQDATAGQKAPGESLSPGYYVESGQQYYGDFSVQTQNWRWYDDEANETPALPLAAENASASDVGLDNAVKLRLAIKETEGVYGMNTKFKLQYSIHSDFSSEVYDVVEIGSCSASSTFCYADGGGADNAVITTKLLSDADACSGGIGNGCGTHNESGISASSFTHPGGAAVEYEFTVKSPDADYNRVYFFRPFDTGRNMPAPLFGASYPSLSIQGAFLVFNVSGLPSGTATEGIVTDIETSPTDISFDIIELDQEKEAAQRLEVQTNAEEGYQIFMFQRQGLLGPTEISPVTGTNEAPLSWALGCAAEAPGCYGYHSGDDSLAGGSVRFSPNDSYAKLETLPKEVAYSSAPVASEFTDIVFKIKVSLNQQPGNYNSSVVYIIVPTF